VAPGAKEAIEGVVGPELRTYMVLTAVVVVVVSDGVAAPEAPDPVSSTVARAPKRSAAAASRERPARAEALGRSGVRRCRCLGVEGGAMRTELIRCMGATFA
jgi:hypothetical protein